MLFISIYIEHSGGFVKGYDGDVIEKSVIFTIEVLGSMKG